MKHELGVIGGGNMCAAIVRGVVSSGFLKAGEVLVAEPLEQRRDALAELGASVTTDNALAAGCPRVLLAVKPQVLAEALSRVSASVRTDALVISIAAGISTARIDELLGGRGRIVRTMPNTPMIVGAGVAAVAGGPRSTPGDLDWTESLLKSCGTVVRVDESMLDSVTAVSGSGPAYFFYLVEAMMDAGVAEGLDPQTALALARGTCLGAGELLVKSGALPQALRAQVTSPGGTTQRAVETMDSAHVKELLVRAIRSAAARSRELGK
jgi:pyrroline-5-carboxylate reductase